MFCGQCCNWHVALKRVNSAWCITELNKNHIKTNYAIIHHCFVETSYENTQQQRKARGTFTCNSSVDFGFNSELVWW